MARTIIITNLTIILLAFLALCVLYPTDVQASNSLSEQFCECESKFWFKSLAHFKQSVKTKCLKETHQKETKRHQSRVCNNKSHDEKALLRKWKKFSNCRCESAMGDLKGFFICYQIVQLNKVTGEFLGELSVYQKKGQRLRVGLKFSHKVKVLNDDQWRKQRGFHFWKKGPRFIEKRDRFLIVRYYVLGKISKIESMNKITLDKISPSRYSLIHGNGKSKSVKLLSTKDKKVVNIPFSRFIHCDLKTIIFNHFKHQVPQKEKDEGKKNAKKPVKEENPTDEGDEEKDAKKPADDEEPNNPNENEGNEEPSIETPNPENDEPPQPDEEIDTTTITKPAEVNKEKEKDKKVPSGKELVIRAGMTLFGCVVVVGSIFVAFNTYERRRLRNRQRNFVSNTSLANVPDYNGYGRAH